MRKQGKMVDIHGVSSFGAERGSAAKHVRRWFSLLAALRLVRSDFFETAGRRFHHRAVGQAVGLDGNRACAPAWARRVT
jgi:hypothetical protein